MRVTIVGCSGSFAGPDSPASSYLVEVDTATGPVRVLFDLGSGALGSLQRHIDPTDLDAIFITHLHPDHCIDMLGLYVHRRYRPQGRPEGRLPVHGPTDTERRIAGSYVGLDDSGMREEFSFSTLTDRATVDVGPVRVTPYRVEHPVEAYGFRVEADGEVLSYTGDTDSCDALLELCGDADLVLADAAFLDGRDTLRGIHLTGRRAAEMAVAARARRLMLTHIPSWNDPEVCRAQASVAWPGQVELARPDATYEVGEGRAREARWA